MEILCCRAHMGPAISEKFKQRLTFRLCLFLVKITSGNAFLKMRLFGWFGKFYFPEIEIRWPKKKKPLTTEIILHFYFPFKVFPENERERERERESARAIAISSSRWSRSRLREIAPDRDRDRRCDLAKIAIDSATTRSSDGVQCRR